MNKTNILWTTLTANPLKYRRTSDGKVVWACVKCSPGCAQCYSEAIALRFDRGKIFNARNMEELEPFLDEKELRHMRTAKTIGGVPVSGSRCFIGDMTDLFGEWVPDDLMNHLFSSVLEIRQDVTWQILTKRAERMRQYLSWRWGEGRLPCRNIHIGVSVENQKAANERIPILLQTPAAVRFLSCEPLLGPIDLMHYASIEPRPPHYWQEQNMLTGWMCGAGRHGCGPGQQGPKIDWAICGGESGPNRRDCRIEWIQSIRDQCREAGVSCFVKQDSGPRPGMQGRLPRELWTVKEFPTTGVSQ